MIMIACSIVFILPLSLYNWKDEEHRSELSSASLIVDEKQWYRLFTAMFLHSNVTQFVSNM